MASSALVIPSTRARPGTLATHDVVLNTTAESTNDDDGADASDKQPSPQKRPRLEQTREDVATISYWPDSPEARQLFRPRRRVLEPAAVVDDDGTARETVRQSIGLLQSVHDSQDGWRNILIRRDENNFCSKVEIFEICQRAIFLCCAPYQIALTDINQITWHECCKWACKFLNSLGLRQATFSKTLQIGTRCSDSSRVFHTPIRTSNVGSVHFRGCLKSFPIPRARLSHLTSRT